MYETGHGLLHGHGEINLCVKNVFVLQNHCKL